MLFALKRWGSSGLEVFLQPAGLAGPEGLSELVGDVRASPDAGLERRPAEDAQHLGGRALLGEAPPQEEGLPAGDAQLLRVLGLRRPPQGAGQQRGGVDAAGLAHTSSLEAA